jgi:ABC-type transport system substrate-binding protein
MRRHTSMWFLVVMVVTGLPRAATAQHPAEGTLTLGMPFTITAALLNPAETTGLTASIVHYALHDALLKLLPGQPMAPALAESWTESPDGRTY